MFCDFLKKLSASCVAFSISYFLLLFIYCCSISHSIDHVLNNSKKMTKKKKLNAFVSIFSLDLSKQTILFFCCLASTSFENYNSFQTMLSFWHGESCWMKIDSSSTVQFQSIYIVGDIHSKFITTLSNWWNNEREHEMNRNTLSTYSTFTSYNIYLLFAVPFMKIVIRTVSFHFNLISSKATTMRLCEVMSANLLKLYSINSDGFNSEINYCLMLTIVESLKLLNAIVSKN